MSYPQLDFAIITALPVEVVHALDIFDDKLRVFVHGKRIFHVGDVHDLTGNSHTGVVITTDSYGASAAATVATELRILWNPRHYYIVGIAGGIGESVELGDLIVSDLVIERFFQKIRPTENGVDIQYRDHNFEVCKPLLEKAKAIVAVNPNFLAEQAKEIAKQSDTVNEVIERRVPIVHIGQLISSNAVVASTTVRNGLRTLYPNSIAVEMEAQGVAHALLDSQYNHRSQFIVVKGVSDLADDGKADSEWRDFSACNSVKFVKSLVIATSSSDSEKFKTLPIGVREAHPSEVSLWLGEQHSAWGKFRKAQEQFQVAYNLAKSDAVEPALVAICAHKLAMSYRQRFELDKAQEYAYIAHNVREESKRRGKLADNSELADSMFLSGLLLRDEARFWEAIEKFKQAQELYIEDQNWIGLTNALRWEGYTVYCQKNYVRAYHLISRSHEILQKRIPALERLPEAAESNDMMSRVLRQIAKVYYGQKTEYMSVRQSQFGLPNSPQECHELAMDYMEGGLKIANDSGDNFKLAESYLSFVIWHYRDGYYGNSKWRKAMKNAYEAGNALAEKYDYHFLISLFEKYMGNAQFEKYNGRPSAFRHYAKRYVAICKVSARERRRALEEIQNKFRSIQDESNGDRLARKYFNNFMQQCKEVFEQKEIEQYMDEWYLFGKNL